MAAPSVLVSTHSPEPLVTRRLEAGVALLEVLVALVILATAGTALVELVGAGLRSERDARERERTLAAEERVLTAITLLKREDFDRRLGQRRVGEFLVDVQRPERTLYRIAIAEARSAQMEDLVTVVYRPEAPGAP
jgi:type II secretory pathway component PulJ